MTVKDKSEALREKRRAERVKDVFDAIAAASKNPKKGTITTRELSQVTGYSQGLCKSTIKLINTTIHEYGKAGSKMIAYHPKRGDSPDGWSVANSWAEWVGWHGTLHRHATTRVESLERFADVMEGLFPTESRRPGALTAFYQTARQALDNATKVMAPRTKPKVQPKSHRKQKVTRVV